MMYDKNKPATLPVMTEFVDRAIDIFENWGYKVTMVNSLESASDLINKTYKRSKKYPERNGYKYGVTAFARGHCWFTSIKTKTINKIAKGEYEMVGYAIDETDRTHRLTDTKQSIMVTLEVTEKDTYPLCRKYNLLSPLYDLGFYRDGCWFCPNAGKHQRQYLKDNHPDLVQEVYRSIEMCEYDISSVSNRNNWVKEYNKSKEEKAQFDIFDYIT